MPRVQRGIERRLLTPTTFSNDDEACDHRAGLSRRRNSAALCLARTSEFADIRTPASRFYAFKLIRSLTPRENSRAKRIPDASSPIPSVVSSPVHEILSPPALGASAGSFLFSRRKACRRNAITADSRLRVELILPRGCVLI